jgi:hypothetical protein
LKNFTLSLSLACFSLFFQKAYSQENYAILEKNVNSDANSLFHELNETKDTLLLKSDKKIKYVYSINKDYQRELNYYMDKNVCKLPLNNLSKGRHTIVVGQSPLKIVFVIRIVENSSSIASIDDD